MRPDDVADVFSIEVSAHSHPWTQGIFRDCLRSAHCCWVWDDQAVLKGYGITLVAAGECHILNLCTHPQYQRQGIGRRLLLHMLSLAIRHGAETAFLEVRPSNAAALRLYQRLGFNEIGVRKDYYPAVSGREDALILARSF